MSLSDPRLCDCICHNQYRGTQKAAQQMGKYMKGFTFAERANQWDQFGCAFTDDAIAAASACPECLNQHCAALLTGVPPRQPRLLPRFNPHSDSQSTTDSDTQADGEKGDENGG